jgi:hypothetical protein
MRAIIQINRNRRLVRELGRIADALERAYPKSDTGLPKMPEVKEEDFHRAETVEEKAKRLIAIAIASGTLSEIEDWDPE